MALLVLVALASIAIGAKSLPLGDVWHGLFHDSGTYADVVVGDRISRTVLGLLAGAALGLSGAVLQALTRNPSRTPASSASTPVPPPPSSPRSRTSVSHR